MYKRASNFMQAMSRRGALNSKPSGVRYKPPTRAEMRQRWYAVIAHHLKANTRVRDHHGKKRYPAWLEKEVENFGPERWLAYWNEHTGKPNRKPSKVEITGQAKADEALRIASQRRREKEQGRQHYDALVLEQRCEVSPLAAALRAALKPGTEN